MSTPHLVQSAGGCPQSCGAGSITGFSCVSRTGSCSLCGYSKYANFNSGDWNTRKLGTLSRNATLESCLYEGGSEGICPGDPGHDYAGVNYYFDGSVSFSGCTAPSATVAFDQWGSLSAQCPDEFIGTVNLSIINGLDTSYDECANYANVLTDFGRSRTGSCTCYVFSGDPEQTITQVVSDIWSLTNPDTVAAAHARGSPTVGAFCQTLPGTIGSTSSLSTSSIALGSATRSVVVTISCAGLTIGQDYEITASLTRRNSVTDAFISTTQVTITFTADAASDTVDYDVPVETGTKVNFDSADSIAAA